MRRILFTSSLLLIGFNTSHLAYAGEPFGIDHRIAHDNSGAWMCSCQKDLATSGAPGILAGVRFADSETRLGQISDHSPDAVISATAVAIACKYTFLRERPNHTSNSNVVLPGHGMQGFPGGEGAQICAIVTPFIAGFRGDYFAVGLLAELPAYVLLRA